MTTSQRVNTYLQDRQAVGALTKRTALRMRGQLYAFAAMCPDDPARISRRHVVRWLGTIQHLAPSTRHLYHAQVRGFTTWLLRRGVVRRDPFLDVPSPRVPRAAHRSLEPTQAQALLDACADPREVVIVVLGLHVGLRRAEIARCEVGDISLTARTLFVRCGKGGHQRNLPLSSEASAIIGRYLASEGVTAGPLLRSLVRPSKGLQPNTIGRLFCELAFRSGVKLRAGDSVGAHSLRHTFATVAHETSHDIVAVSELLGHQSLNTTRRYVRGMSVERLRSVVEGQHYLAGAA